jgi:t-SNARE complex subunit (syntaxin)
MSDKQENDGVDVTQTESRTYQEVPPKTKKHTVARHCKRFWWAYLIVLICIVVLVVCLV